MSPPGQTTAGFGTAQWRRPGCAYLPTPSWLLLLCCTLPSVSRPGCWPSTGRSRSLTGRAPRRQTTPDRRSNSGNSSTRAFLAAQMANRLHSPLSRQTFQAPVSPQDRGLGCNRHHGPCRSFPGPAERPLAVLLVQPERDLLVQRRMVVLQGQHVVVPWPRRSVRPRPSLLAADGVDADYRATRVYLLHQLQQGW